MEEEKDKQIELLLVDGSALLHRAYHAYPKLTTKSGKIVNAVYGVASIFMSAMEQINPEYVSVAWDVAKPTFRHEMYIGYKAHRPKTDQDLIDQIPLVYEMLDAWDVNQVKREGYEADDLIGSMADKFKTQVDKVVILTGDQDIMQLIDKNVGVLVPGRGKDGSKLYMSEEVRERYQIDPAQIVDYKALVGDPSDNIPGVAGVGPKTAVQLLSKYEDVNGVYANIEKVADAVSPRVQKLLQDSKDSAYLSQELAQIKRDMEIDEKLDELEYMGAEKEELKEFFERMNFRSLVKRIFGEEKKDDNQMGLF